MKIPIQQAFAQLESFCAKSATTFKQIVDNLADNWLDHLTAFHNVDTSHNLLEPYGEQTITQITDQGDADDLPETTEEFDGPVIIAYHCDLYSSEFDGDCVPFVRPEMFEGANTFARPQGPFKVIVPKGCSFAFSDGSSYFTVRDQSVCVSIIFDGDDVTMTKTAPFIEL